jgi:hypothetical protein
MEIFILLQIIFIFTAFAVISQLFISFIVKRIFNQIVDVSQKLKDKNEYKESDIRKEAANLDVVKAKKRKLGFITCIIGTGELLVFGSLVAILIENYQFNFLDKVGIFFKFLGVWVGIKTLGNYQQWAGAIFGRACFYLFIIGTLLNILFAIGFGMILSSLF